MSDENRSGSKNQNAGNPRAMSSGIGRGLRGGFAAGPGGSCVCPNCGQEASHHLGVPCNQQKCPKCGSFMIRK